MFIDSQPKKHIDYYSDILVSLGVLSRLFSQSAHPYLYYRATENLFCKAFDAENLSRGDTSADASKDGIGIGIKTFLYKNGRSLEKVAEFNGDHKEFSGLGPVAKVKKISELRNERIESTKRIHSLNDLIYHCIVRKPGKILIHEEPMHLIDIKNIKSVKVVGNAITFTDGKEEYSFYGPKSTLFKQFNISNVKLEVSVSIIDDPFSILQDLIKSSIKEVAVSNLKEIASVYLPLYGMSKDGPKVFEASGLNHWNADDEKRARKPNEVYIPIPAWIHKSFPGFFPNKNTSFDLALPNGKVMSAKVCQSGSKALMSNPNANLGEWILRDVLRVPENKLVSYDDLKSIGLDSVRVAKMEDGTFQIDFKEVGSYQEFVDLHLD